MTLLQLLESMQQSMAPTPCSREAGMRRQNDKRRLEAQARIRNWIAAHQGIVTNANAAAKQCRCCYFLMHSQLQSCVEAGTARVVKPVGKIGVWYQIGEAA